MCRNNLGNGNVSENIGWEESDLYLMIFFIENFVKIEFRI